MIKRVPAERRVARELGTPADLSALERHGFVRSHIGEHGSIVRLPTKGLEIKNAYDARVQAVERAWRQRFSNDIVVELRRSLDAIAEKTRAGNAEPRHQSPSGA